MSIVMFKGSKKTVLWKFLKYTFLVAISGVLICGGLVPLEAVGLESCNQCKFKEAIEKEIKDNEALRDKYKQQADDWKKEIEAVKATGRGYPDYRRESDLDKYLNQGRQERENSFMQSRGYSNVTSLETNPIICESDVVPKKNPGQEKARKEKVEKFKKNIKCQEIFDLSVQHEKNHVDACEKRKKDKIKVTAEDLAREEMQEYQKMIDELNKILNSINAKKCKPDQPRYLKKKDTEKQKQKIRGADKRVKKYSGSLK